MPCQPPSLSLTGAITGEHRHFCLSLSLTGAIADEQMRFPLLLSSLIHLLFSCVHSLISSPAGVHRWLFRHHTSAVDLPCVSSVRSSLIVDGFGSLLLVVSYSSCYVLAFLEPEVPDRDHMIEHEWIRVRLLDRDGLGRG